MSVVGSHQANVTVNSRARDQVTPAIVTTPHAQRAQARPGHVIITPLANATGLALPSTSQVLARNGCNFRQQATPGQRSDHLQSMLGHAGSQKRTESMLLKAVCKSTKQSSKTFTLRDVDIASVNSRDQLKMVIKEQLQDDLVKEFDVGYYQSSTVVSIRSPQDLAEVWNDFKGGKKVTLWCDGLKEEESAKSRKKKQVCELDSEESDQEETDCQKRCGKKRKYKLKDKKL